MKRPLVPEGQRGMTLMELLFVLAMVGVLLVSVVRFVGNSRFSLIRAEIQDQLQVNNRRISANLRAAVQVSEHLLPRSATNEYDGLRDLIKASVQALGPYKPVPFSLSPRIVNADEPQLLPVTATTAVEWGNELIFAAGLQPTVVTVCYANCGTVNSTTIQEQVSLERVQFVYIYLAQDPATRILGLPGGGLRLVEWRSAPMLKYQTLSSFTGARITGSVKAAVTAGYLWAYDSTQAASVASAFYALNGSTGAITLSAPPGTLAQSHWALMDEYELNSNSGSRPGLNRGRIRSASNAGKVAGPFSIAVALNTLNPTVNPAWKAVELRGPGKILQVPAHAQPDNIQANFPGGFEVSIWGKPQARHVYFRTVLMGSGGFDPRAPAKTFLAHESTQHFAVRNE